MRLATPSRSAALLASVLTLAGCSGTPAADSAPAPAGSESALPTSEPQTEPTTVGQGAALPSEEAGYYTEAQAEKGRDAFRAACAECHATSDFRGRDFEWTWRRQTARNLFREMVQTMPEDAPGSLEDETYAAIVAYVLQLNEYPSGTVVLAPTDEALEAVPLGPDARNDH